MQKNNHRNPVILLAATLLIISIINITDITSELFFNTTYPAGAGQNFMFKEFSSINKALKSKIQQQQFTFNSTGPSPFRPIDAAPTNKGSGLIQKQDTGKKLFLKGTLLKEDALAILIDEDGKTYICKQGDLIDDQVIAAISDNTVTIKHGTVTKVLKVQEP